MIEWNYDRVEWPFLESLLIKLGFAQSFVHLVMLCVRSVTYYVSLNGHILDPIQPGRGFGKGIHFHLICLYLLRKLSLLYFGMLKRGVLRGVAISSTTPRISHLLFADDTLLFCDASVSAAMEIQTILNLYSLASGQEINLDKSTIVFSCNTGSVRVEEVRDSLGVGVVEKHEKYLGLHLEILGLHLEMGRSKREVFSWLRERVWSKTQGFGEKFLSGGEVLIKSVLQSIPTYVMSCFKLHDYLLHEIESLIAKFWWGDGKKNMIHWLIGTPYVIVKEMGDGFS